MITFRLRTVGLRPTLLVATFVACGCVTSAPPSRSASPSAIALDRVATARYGAKRCGAGALATVLDYWGRPVDVETLDRSLDKARKGGVLTVDLMLEARARGFRAELLEGNRTLIANSIVQRVPLILLVRVMNAPGGRADLYHYVVVDGWDGELDLVRVHFGDGVRRWAELERLDRSWARAGHTALRIRPEQESGLPPPP